MVESLWSAFIQANIAVYYVYLYSKHCISYLRMLYTVFMEHDVTGNGHTDVTTMGVTHMHTGRECYSALDHSEEVGGTVGGTTMGG